MKIIDRTPYRSENGQIELLGRLQGSLQYGMNWYARLQAQDAVIAILEKILKDNYVLLRNVTLEGPDIPLPLVLLGPPGVFLINVIHEKGVYRARDDEWGTVSGEKFVPAKINRVEVTQKLGRVIQVYLARNGFKDSVVVEPILMSADPGTHIDSTRPAVRIIMSDALERFAISLNQNRALLSPETIFKIVKLILEGPEPKPERASASAASNAGRITPSNGGTDTTDALFSSAEDGNSFGREGLGFSFDEEPARQQPAARPAPAQPRPAAPRQPSADFQTNNYADPGYQSASSGSFQPSPFEPNSYDEYPAQASPFQTSPFDEEAFPEASQTGADTEPPAFARPETPSGSPAKPKPSPAKKKGLFGLTTAQILILGAILLFWLCAMAAFGIYIFFFA